MEGGDVHSQSPHHHLRRLSQHTTCFPYGLRHWYHLHRGQHYPAVNDHEVRGSGLDIYVPVQVFWCLGQGKRTGDLGAI